MLETLGEPRGSVQAGPIEYLQYQRGSVEIQDGKVVDSTIVSKEEYEKREALRKQQAKERQRLAANDKKKRIEEGTTEKARILEDKHFANSPPSEQLTTWKRFAAKYPEVDVRAELNKAKAQQESQRKKDLAAQETDKGPPKGLSRSKLRKYKRGRYKGASKK